MVLSTSIPLCRLETQFWGQRSWVFLKLPAFCLTFFHSYGPPLTFRFKALPLSLPSCVYYCTGQLSIRAAGLDVSLHRVRVPLVLLRALVYMYEYCPSTLLMYLPTEALLRLRLWPSQLGIVSFGAFVAVSTKRSRQ
jgi:hypothetical protein